MRPKSIVIFELVFFVSMVLGVIQSWLGWEGLAQTSSIGRLLAIQIGTFAILGGLVLLVSRKRSRIAFWIIILLTLFGLPVVFVIFSSGQLIGSAWITLIQTFAQLGAIALLFLPSSRKWMASTEDEIDLTKTFS